MNTPGQPQSNDARARPGPRIVVRDMLCGIHRCGYSECGLVKKMSMANARAKTQRGARKGPSRRPLKIINRPEKPHLAPHDLQLSRRKRAPCIIDQRLPGAGVTDLLSGKLNFLMPGWPDLSGFCVFMYIRCNILRTEKAFSSPRPAICGFAEKGFSEHWCGSSKET